MRSDARKRQVLTYTLAEALCLTDDTWHHHERTDDYPCSRCTARAEEIRSLIGGQS